MKVTIFHTAFATQNNIDNCGTSIYEVDTCVTETALNKAYACSNGHGDGNDSQVFRAGRCYSASVGDVFKIDEKYFVCAPVGFKKITERDFIRLQGRWMHKTVRCFWEDVARHLGADKPLWDETKCLVKFI